MDLGKQACLQIPLRVFDHKISCCIRRFESSTSNSSFVASLFGVFTVRYILCFRLLLKFAQLSAPLRFIETRLCQRASAHPCRPKTTNEWVGMKIQLLLRNTNNWNIVFSMILYMKNNSILQLNLGQEVELSFWFNQINWSSRWKAYYVCDPITLNNRFRTSYQTELFKESCDDPHARSMHPMNV